MSIILDWIFEGIVNWIASIVTSIMDTISGIFLNALGTDMVAMEEYFPFITKAFTIMQYTAWCILFLITIWQLFRVFGGPITEAENPWHLLARSILFAFLIGYAQPIFSIVLEIVRAPYTALMDSSMNPGDFTFAGIEQALTSGIVTFVAISSIVGLLLIVILMIALGWNYFKMLLEVVERYIVVGVLCYTSPLAFAMGGSKTTNKVFQSWCRMVGSQLLLLVMNVWFLRAFNSSVGQFTANGGALTNGHGNIFLWLFCALAFLKTAQKFDSILASLGLSVAQTGGNMGMELLMASRMLGGMGGGGSKTAGSIFRGGSAAGGAASAAGAAGSGGFMSGFASKFKGNSYVRDAVVQGGSHMGAGGGIGFVGRAFGGMAAKSGATLTGESISSVAARHPSVSGSIAGDIADRSLANYMPHLNGKKLSGTQVTGGMISTTAIGTNGKESSVQMYNAAQYDRPSTPNSIVKASDGSTWYQTASGAGMSEFYSAPNFTGDASEASKAAAAFPSAPEGTTLRTVDDGVMEAAYADGSNGLWYNSAVYQEPDAPHETMTSADGVDWYAMQPHSAMPEFETGEISNGGIDPSSISGVDYGDIQNGINNDTGTADSGINESGDISETSTLTENIAPQNASVNESGVAGEGTTSGMMNASDTSESGDINETSTLTDNIAPQNASVNESGVAVAEGTSGMMNASDASESGDISETSTLTDNIAPQNASVNESGVAVAEGTTSGMMNASDTSESGNISETSTLTENIAPQNASANESGVAVAEGTSGMMNASGTNESGNISETSILTDNIASQNAPVNESRADSKVANGAAADTKTNEIPEIRETSNFAGGAGISAVSPITKHSDAPADATENTSDVRGTTEVKDSSAISSSSASVASETASIPDGSSGIKIDGTAHETSNIQDSSALLGNAAQPSNIDAGHNVINGSTDSVNVTTPNLASAQDSVVPQDNTVLPGSGIATNHGNTSVPQDNQPNLETKTFDPAAAAEFNQAQFQQFMPAYGQQASQINFSRKDDGILEIRHADGTGTAFYDKTMYQTPRGDHKLYEDKNGGQWYAIQGTPTVEHRPVYENGKPVYDGEKMRTVSVEGMKYKTTPTKFNEPNKRNSQDQKPPRKK